jgi:hypothetical protein
MTTPEITGYHIEEVDVPPPKERRQIILEVLGLAAPAPPEGEPRRRLAITLDGSGFAMTAIPFEISIGDRRIESLRILGDGTQATGLIDGVPSDGDPIAIHTVEPHRDSVIVARFDRAKLEDRRIT